jgi:hypothetical protein
VRWSWESFPEYLVIKRALQAAFILATQGFYQ